ncbi:PREDICTED: RWD domain-containing protein 2A [Drosophila arizonae]|uniref:RWD domain-containing protein 2A n=1 Tax=Drosophila arizonae TaxID=7263 RepID=A0ABM1PH05_DROAR|nr:PREDICTED: RWD domain-containing protein 2A [Drosophila arizonae]
MDLQVYRCCIGLQLEELDLLSSIYCAAGELQLLDAGVVADFSEFLQSESEASLRSHLEYIIRLTVAAKQCVDVRIELPHLYPQLELARISVHTPLLDKIKEQHLKLQIDNYLLEQRQAEEPYIFQLLSWLQDQIEALMSCTSSDLECPPSEEPKEPKGMQLERLWIYSHHIKSSAKRQELVRQARQLQLTGFSRPGKPGIICVEGEPENVQEYWRSIKALRWQKISLVRTEPCHKRRFEHFTEQLFNSSAAGGEEGVINMGQFIRFLEDHGTGYMKSELFGLA